MKVGRGGPHEGRRRTNHPRRDCFYDWTSEDPDNEQHNSVNPQNQRRPHSNLDMRDSTTTTTAPCRD